MTTMTKEALMAAGATIDRRAAKQFAPACWVVSVPGLPSVVTGRTEEAAWAAAVASQGEFLRRAALSPAERAAEDGRKQRDAARGDAYLDGDERALGAGPNEH